MNIASLTCYDLVSQSAIINTAGSTNLGLTVTITLGLNPFNFLLIYFCFFLLNLESFVYVSLELVSPALLKSIISSILFFRSLFMDSKMNI